LPGPAPGSRVVVCPKYFQDIFIGEFVRIVINLKNFRVIAKAVIGGVIESTARVTNTGPVYAF